MEMKHAYLGKVYSHDIIKELVHNFRSQQLVVRFLKDRLNIHSVTCVWTDNDWKTEPFHETVMKYDEHTGEFSCTIPFQNAVNGIGYRFKIQDTPDSCERWEDKNHQNWYVVTKNKINFKQSENIAAETAQLLSEEKIIGWFQGASEFGPRALGHRSILADPRKAEMKDILNDRVKHRESFRPFAPSVLLEHESEYFDLDIPSPFMLLVANVHKDKQSIIPAVTHVDGTARLQTVTQEANGIYYDLINEFKNITGVPVILNTSFNLAGEPIVETPLDALICFQNTQMDYLVLHDYLIWKEF